MKKEKKIELIEEYNPQGVCVRRTINGYDLPADKKPSIVIYGNVSSITRKSYLTEEEAREKYRYTLKNQKTK